ncbi:polysaccharide biosynthesis C-terminal domain-containing protein [Lachnospiraceae bacterium JLR.KK008]
MTVRKNRKKQANLIAQGGIMAVAFLLANACILFRRIPLTAILGDQGNSIYAAAFGVFSFACLIAAYGLPIAVSALLKVRLKQGQYKSVGKVMRIAFLYATVVGSGLGVLLFFAGTLIAEYVMLEPLAALPLQALSVAVPIAAWNGVVRGFFMGSGARFPVVFSVLLEQGVTLGVGFPLSEYLRRYGQKVGALLQNETAALSYAILGFAGGVALGIALSFLFLLLVYPLANVYYKKNGKEFGRRSEGMTVIPFFASLFAAFLSGLFLWGYVLPQQIAFRLLVRDSMKTTLISQQWGMYYGKYKLFMALPLVLTIAMSATLQSRIVSLNRREQYQQTSDFIQNVMQAVMIAVLPLSVMIGTLSGPLLATLFPQQNGQVASELMLTGCLSAVLFAAAYVLTEALRGMKKMASALACGAMAFAFQMGALYVMLDIMQLDISGVLYADLLYAFVLTALLGASVRRRCRFRHGLLRSNVPAAVASAVMGVVLFGLTKALASVVSPPVLLIVGIVLGCVVYAAVLLMLRGVSERQLRLVPGGRWLCMAGKALRLL